MSTPTCDPADLIRMTVAQFDAMAAVVADLDDATANWVPQGQDHVNSCVQLATHCCGMTRRWLSTVNLGVEIPRDRDGEFSAVASVAETTALLQATRAAMVADLAATDWELAPVAVPADKTAFWVNSRVMILLHVFEELSQHLGHMQITLDWYRATHS